MCTICGKLFCAATCPNYTGFNVLRGIAEGRCTICDEAIFEGSHIYERNGKTVCEDCAATMEIETLLSVSECENTEELLEELGFVCRSV